MDVQLLDLPPAAPPMRWAQTPAAPAAPASAPALRSRLPQKTERANLRRQYGMTVQLSFVLALLILVGLLHVDLEGAGTAPDELVVAQEVVQMEEIQQTAQPPKPPPPPRPQVLVTVADETILDDIELNLDATLDIGEPLAELPPPPPMPEPAAEAEEEPEEEIFVVVEHMPKLIGGIASIQSRIEYPEVARLAGIEGKVIVQFVVDETGRVRDPMVLRGIGGGCDEEALRAVQLATFEPGRQRGKPVSVRYVVPVTFKLK